jgi:flagellar assembly factor FliW
MFIETERFGNFDSEDVRIIDFPVGLPGFEEFRKFIILEIPQTKPLYWLQSVENKYIALPVIIPFEFIEDYYIDIRDTELGEFEIQDQNDLLILNVVVVPGDIKKMTVNLAAPIIINTKGGKGKQIIIDAAELPIRYPIYDAIVKKLKGGAEDAGADEKRG